MARIDVVGLGVSTVDLLSAVDHFPTEREVQRAAAMTLEGGGPVATAVVTLARLGASVAMIDQVGDDWRGKIILEEFRQEGVLTEHIRVRAGHTSSTACILVAAEKGARAIVYYPGTVPELTAGDIDRRVVEAAGILHINGRHFEACLQAMAWARQANVPVSFDGGANRYRPELRRIVPATDICIVARDFAERYTEQTNLEDAGRALLDCGPELVAVTDGLNGSWIFSKTGENFFQKAYPLPQTIDSTGCGDSYHGAFLYGVVKKRSLRQSAAIASAVAAMNSQFLGGRRGLPTLDQVELFLAEKNR
ncbi:MAG: carbohydrate kinase family protein [Negativicutes bacterium]|nr:carbohydrate kinase family protein [Negativicutes bacterium]